ncbi:MAG: SMC-Scp complex subunit ScpB [Candidatus Odinarchaeota archaeon]
MKDNNYNDKIVGNNQINNEEKKSNDASETNNESIKEELTISLTNEKLNEVTIESELEQEKLSQDSEYAAQIELAELNKNLIEGALYASGRPLDIEELSTKLEIPKKDVEELVHQIAFDYLERSSALIVAQVGDRFQMQLRPEYTERVAKFAKGGGISEAYLRTLTIIALKQPILKSTVVKIRGSGAYEHFKYLLDNDLISAVKKGRTHELTTTDKYADMFGLPKNKEELKKMMITQLGIEQIDKE